MRPSLDEYFMGFARQAATRATCPRKHVGAAIVVRDLSGQEHVTATGYNGSLPKQAHCTDVGVGCLIEEGHCRRTVHAEANAITQAAKHGHATDGGTLYVTASPCEPCFMLAVSAGIRRVVFGEAYRAEDPGPKRVLKVAAEVGVEVVQLAKETVVRVPIASDMPVIHFVPIANGTCVRCGQHSSAAARWNWTDREDLYSATQNFTRCVEDHVRASYPVDATMTTQVGTQIVATRESATVPSVHFVSAKDARDDLEAIARNMALALGLDFAGRLPDKEFTVGELLVHELTLRDALLTDIDDIEWSSGVWARVTGGMKQLGVKYVGDLVGHTEYDLMRLRNFGRKSLKAVKEALAGRDLHLGITLIGWKIMREEKERVA